MIHLLARYEIRKKSKNPIYRKYIIRNLIGNQMLLQPGLVFR